MAKKSATKLFTDVSTTDGPVECLGMKFDSDAARRAYFTEKLREKLQDPEFRKIEGFPIGDDDDILALSDPPYYTACPNPFLNDFISLHARPYQPESDSYHREPFAADVSEGKNDPVYSAHSYHTKVPHKAIVRYILHYTSPGDLVFDGFCGTGMAGVAADRCADKATIAELGYSVAEDGSVKDEHGSIISSLGQRACVLNELAPIATFIAQNYNSPFDSPLFESAANEILDTLNDTCGWMYNTLHDPTQATLKSATDSLANARGPINADSLCPDAKWGTINYTVWSDVISCPTCQNTCVYWDEAVEHENDVVHKEFPCPSCGAQLSRRNLERYFESVMDHDLAEVVRRPKQVPVLINYSFAGSRYEKRPDIFDLAVVDTLENQPTPHWLPLVPMCSKGTNWGDLCRGYHEGTTHVHQFYTKRNRWILAAMFEEIVKHDGRLRQVLTTWFTSCHSRLTRLNRYMPNHGRHVGPLSGTYYLSSLPTEISPFYFCKYKLDEFASLRFPKSRHCMVGTCSTESLTELSETIDYIFTDPPFGDNLPYSELNFLWESWLRVRTNNSREAIVSRFHGKDTHDYQQLMEASFRVYYAALKPGRWITVEFHNSRNAIWNSIQEAMGNAGFIVGDVRTLDKKKGTTKQLFYTSGAVKQDLVISAYKPTAEFERRFSLEAGTEEGVWDFLSDHLRHLPVMVASGDRAEVVAERQDYLLFDRMVAFHVQRGVTVPLSAAEFYAGLRQRFPERDGMFFLPEQVTDYDKRRMKVTKLQQLELFVSDEASAIQWLKQQLMKKPQTYQELSPQFMREIAGWEKHERMLELSDLLKENFLLYDAKGDVPSQVHSYLSTNFHELRNLEKGDPKLISKAKNRWYVPDPRKEADVEKIRLRALMKEFDEYRESKGKLKVVRMEALRTGFKQCWQDGDYQTIVNLAKRVKEDIIQEDPALLMYYDNASMRTED